MKVMDQATDRIWFIIMTYPIWDRRLNKPLCEDLKGFNLLNRIYKRLVEN